MKKVIIDPAFWELFPQGQINVLVVKGVDNHFQAGQEDSLKQLLSEASQTAQQFVQAESISENPVVAQWREAFSQFKTKKGARSSIEALLKRAKQGRDFLPINPLVDVYNSVSLKYGVPCGGEDIEQLQGDLHLGKAQGGEAFFPLGAEKDAPALEGEIIYYDEAGAVCRCLNWREAKRTMLTEKTTNAVFFIEAINSEQAERANEAAAELSKLFKEQLQVESVGSQLTRENSEFIL
ncbi:B3/B4 domain-containing protein [Enterococcus pallens]|uniref:B3/4 protein n=1 Tax=Enterococcus pallens ATCC BAA-351 TaxID=1158607 RepID=R2QLV8_9ENTE|nr:phenylalanine--tRNA ligase beta subunit-related protein [Enterococcus pallens]EOH97542.1 B3/4 protein [Enterococcus pallens ATCC BAA-351]EOU21039.1 B3/4 protein [Enterococcus pallens ATCC BAA-351]OJG77827.1 B3/4 protein [Enterococcus pallens]